MSVLRFSRVKIRIVFVFLTLHTADGTTKSKGITGDIVNKNDVTLPVLVSPTLALYHANVTWQQAFTNCREMGSYLAVSVTSDERSAFQEIIGPREHVWVGGYTYDTPWMYSTGCYRSNNSKYTRIENNDLATCKRHCGDSDIMISNNKCLCVVTASDVGAWKIASECDVMNHGNESNTSGGNVFQHYSTYTRTKQELPGNNCGMYERSNYAADFRILARNCEARNPSLCMSYDDVTNKTWLYSLKDNNGTVLNLRYDEAEDLCKRNGSILADPSLLSAIVMKAEDPIRYWIGTRRETETLRSTDGLPASTADLMCLYITRLSTRVAGNKRKPCHQPSSYLCRTSKLTLTSKTDADSSDTGKREATIAIISAVIVALVVLAVFVLVRSKRIQIERMCCLVTSKTHIENISLQLMEHTDYHQDNQRY